MNEAVTLPHLRPLRGRPLLLTWLALIAGSWVGAYLVLRVACAAYHAVLGLF